MGIFPKETYLKPYINQRPTFYGGMGYSAQSPVTRALSSRLQAMATASDTTTRNAVLPLQVSCSSDPLLRGAADHVNSLAAGSRTVSHTALNITREDMYKLDHLFLSIEMALEPFYYASVVNNIQDGNHNKHLNFSRQPFQQFLLLDSIVTMIKRAGLEEHSLLVIMHVRKLLDYNWMTYADASKLLKLLSGMVVGHNIRRRMGKSVAVYAELARCLSFYPVAGIKALYTVHKSPAAETCLQTVSSHVIDMVTYFNKRQAEGYTRRIDARGGIVDAEDYYYKATANVLRHGKSVSVYFYKRTRHGDVTSAKPTCNQLKCQAYVEKDVSYMIWISMRLMRLLFSLMCVVHRRNSSRSRYSFPPKRTHFPAGKSGCVMNRCPVFVFM